MKYLKKFESDSTKIFNKGDLVRFISSDKYGNNIYYVYDINLSSFGNESLLFPYDEMIKYWNDQLKDVNGVGWIDNDEIKGISEEEADSIKYNL